MNLVKNDTLFEIVSGCKKHNSTVQHRLYQIYAKRMMALCQRYCSDYETARDLMHDGFLRVFESIENFDGKGNFDVWLKKIFVNVCIDNLRKNDVLKMPIEVESLENFIADKQTDFSEKIDIEQIMNAISQLPKIARTVFNMYNIDGYSIEEIAQELNMTSTAVRTQHSRAKQKLQEMLKELGIRN